MADIKYDKILDELRENDVTSATAVTSITGTTNQVLANGTSGSAQTGAVTVALAQGAANQVLAMTKTGTDNEYKTIQGTTNQITVNSGTAGFITISTPQNIHTAATPTFADLTLSNRTSGRVAYYTTGGQLTDSSSWTFNGTKQIGVEAEFSQTQTAGSFTFTNARALTAGTTLSPSGANSDVRIWSLFGGSAYASNNNSTNADAVNGMEFNAGISAGFSGNIGGMNGVYLYCYNNGTGTATTANAVKISGFDTPNGGHITNANFIYILPWAPGFSANSQTRFGVYIAQTMPDPGAFTGTKVAAFYVDSSSASPRDGFNVNNDVIFYRSAANTFKIASDLAGTGAAHLIATGALTAGTNVTAPTSVITPLVNPSAAGTALTLQTLAISGLGTSGNINLTVGTGAKGANGGSIVLTPGAGTAVGSIQLKDSASATKIEVNATGIGAFATAPVAQQTSVAAATALVNYGLLTSPLGLAVVATGRSTGQTGAVASIATYTVPAADHSYLISGNVNVTTYTAGTITLQCDYTDEGNTARTFTFTVSTLTGTLGTTVGAAGPAEGIPVHIRCKASTAITIRTTVSLANFTYNVEGAVTLIN